MVVRIQHSYENWKLDRQIKSENLKKLKNQNLEFNLNVEVADRLMHPEKHKVKVNGRVEEPYLNGHKN
jgi:hypothetical protein